jgi:hypothetical protein
MGLRGPRPAPIAEKIRRGVRPSRIDWNEPIPIAGHVVLPKGMSAAARAVARRILREPGNDRLSGGAGYCLRLLAEATLRYEVAQDLLAHSSPLLKGTRGTLVKNPLCSIVSEELKTIIQLRRELERMRASQSTDVFADLHEVIGYSPRERVLRGESLTN